MIECPLKSAAKEEPKRTALEAPEGRFSFAELDRAVDDVAAGIEPIGPRVAFHLDNGWKLAVLILGAIRAGVTACPLSTRLPAAVAREQARSIGARLLDDDIPTEPGGYRPATISADHPATIVFTSGSSGSPRAALHTFGNHYFSAAGSNANIPLQPGDRWLLSLPLYHVGGLAILFRCLVGRATVVIPDRKMPISEAARTASHVSMVSTQLRRFMDEGVSGDPLKALLLGGSAIPWPLIERANTAGLPIHTSYGLTEMASQVTATAPGASMSELRSSGRALPFREVRLSRDGEIQVRGATRFAGYVSDREIVQPFDEEGWFATRDLGIIDSDGLLHVRGRMDNMFISGGENVMPEEIEGALGTIPGVHRSVVVPVSDEEYGFRPVAFVESSLRPSQIRDALSEILPRYKIPIRIFGWPTGEEEARMKVDRAWFRGAAQDLMAKNG